MGNQNAKNLRNLLSKFEKPNASWVEKSGVKTHGSHGSSGLDANERRKLLTSCKASTSNLCKTNGKLAIRIATSHMNFFLLYNFFRFISLEKVPCARPNGIGVLWPIIGRVTVKCVKTDLKILGVDQLICLSQAGGIEHALYSLRAAFKNTEQQVISHINAKNAFSYLNRDLTFKKSRQFEMISIIQYIIHTLNH